MRLSAREAASHAPKGNILTQRAQSSAWIVKVALPQLQEVVAVMKGALLVPLQLALAVFLVQPAAAGHKQCRHKVVLYIRQREVSLS